MNETEQVVQKTEQSQPQKVRTAIYLSTNRSLAKLIIFSLLTFGIYGLVYYSRISDDVNLIVSRYDGKRTMHYCLMFFIVSPLTLGIGGLVWFHNISNRIGGEIYHRGLNYRFGAGSFWGWNFLGMLLFILGDAAAFIPSFIQEKVGVFLALIIYVACWICSAVFLLTYNYKLAKAMNILCDSYNKDGI